MRKTALIERLETDRGRPIRELVVDALNQHGTIKPAAESLGVNPNTFYYWIIRLDIRRRTVVDTTELAEEAIA